MPGIEVTQTHYHDTPQQPAYDQGPPQQQGQYPQQWAPQGSYPQQQGNHPQQQGSYQPYGAYQPQQSSYQPQQSNFPPGAVGMMSGPGSTMPTFYAPADMDEHPIYCGTALRGPFKLCCGPCGYQGDPRVVSKKGCGWVVVLFMTFGLSLLCIGWGQDTYIVCPQCQKAVGVAKIM